ncbi:hypothetical protein M422DRAFT_256240 [Sphaerobolus stellatus SS14]|uniref:Uncharacterized protein n=1 Tax=Sphaerobolus stellatus (strain SS14) TaxID=990650 RepID=A0A0C9VHB1_SPHS4|nr:hypothetical protein M422DRAFT_256240 [Sphaerobolus stellatus SS14]
MPLCSAPLCKKAFPTQRGLQAHINQSPACHAVLLRQTTLLGSQSTLDPSDLETWPSRQEEPSADLLDQINNSHFEHILADDIGSDVDSDFNDPPPDLESDMDIEDVVLPSISGPNSLLNPNGKEVQRYSFNPFSKSTKMQKTTRRIPYEETKAEIQKNLGGIDTYPFCNIQEWGLAKWLGTSRLPQTQIDNFLNLPWVKDRDSSCQPRVLLLGKVPG